MEREIATADDIERECLALPQVDIPLVHHFGPNIYMREITIPPETLVVGHKHRHEHMCLMMKGTLYVMDGDGEPHELVAPMIFTAPPGRKIGYAVDEVVFVNVFSTEVRDVDVIEEMFVEKSAAWADFDQARRLIEYAEDSEWRS